MQIASSTEQPTTTTYGQRERHILQCSLKCGLWDGRKEPNSATHLQHKVGNSSCVLREDGRRHAADAAERLHGSRHAVQEAGRANVQGLDECLTQILQYCLQLPCWENCSQCPACTSHDQAADAVLVCIGMLADRQCKSGVLVLLKLPVQTSSTSRSCSDDSRAASILHKHWWQLASLRVMVATSHCRCQQQRRCLAAPG